MLATAASGPCDPSFRVRVSLLGDALARHGIDLHARLLFSAEQAQAFRGGSWSRRAAVLATARRDLREGLRAVPVRADTVLVQRRVDLAPWLSLERKAIAGHRFVYDVDDAIWLSGRQTAGHPLSRLKGAERKVGWLTRRADHVIAGNELLAERLLAYGSPVSVVPSLVDTDSCAIRRHEQGETLTLGWIGSPTTAGYLRRLTPILERLVKLCDRPVRLLVVGGPAPRVRGVDVHVMRWTPRAERAVLEEMDIGLMPLADTPWTRGKCAYKAIQYMASGIPAVVDDVGVSARVVGDAGAVASNESDWLEALLALGSDPAHRARLGANGRLRAEQEFSYMRWSPVLAAILVGERRCP